MNNARRIRNGRRSPKHSSTIHHILNQHEHESRIIQPFPDLVSKNKDDQNALMYKITNDISLVIMEFF